VDKNIAKYIREGKRRGFSVNLLRRKLLEGGFNEKDINQALGSLKGAKIDHVGGPMPKLPKQRVLSSKDLDGRESTGSRVMRRAGISGMILFFLGLLGFIASLLTVIPFLFSDGGSTISGFQEVFDFGSSGSGLSLILPIISVLLFLVTSILWLLFWTGFVGMGKRTKSKNLELSAKLIIVFGGLSILSYLAIFVVGLSASGVQIISIIMKVAALFLLFSVISLIYFSIYLIKEKSIKYARLSGILFLVVSFFASIAALFYGLLLFFPDLILSLTGVLLSFALVLANPATGLFISITVLAAILFGSLSLFNASKEFE